MFSVSEKMASFKIHIDDENNTLREKAKKAPNQRRTALSTLPKNDLDRFAREGVKSGVTNGHIIKESSLGHKYLPEISSSSTSVVAPSDENLVSKAAIKGNAKKIEANVVASPIRPPLKERQVSTLVEPIVKNDAAQVKVGPSDAEKPKAVVACAEPSKDDVELLDNSPMVVDVSSSARHSDSLNYYSCCSSYFEDIYVYLRKSETLHGPKPYYMKRQPDVTYTMRTILVDWLVEVSEEFKLRSETLFLAVSLIDRFLSNMAVTRSRLQLLGTSALMIAAKFEEIYPPEVGEFAYITDDTYTRKQVLRMEVLILEALGFNLSRPTPFTFLTILSSKLNITRKTLNLAMYITELTLLEADPYLEFNPSLIACASIALSRHCLRVDDVWPSSMERVTKYSYGQLGPVMKHLNETHKTSFDGTYKAIRDKYKSNKYFNVSLVESRSLLIRERV